MSEDELKRRNYVIVGSIGGFFLPLAGLIGALAFYSNDDHAGARIVAIASVAGLIAYLVVFAVL